MDLPEPIQAYFQADRGRSEDVLTRLLSSDAVVRDEGRTHTGRGAIGAWWRDAKRRYGHVAEPLEMSVRDDRVEVLARVTGRFPGSPASLRFTFRLMNDEIAELDIRA